MRSPRSRSSAIATSACCCCTPPIVDGTSRQHRPQFGIFFLCTTHTPEVAATRSHRWVQDPAELERIELFHPLVADLIGRALDDRPGAR
jgi:hypothetical protein